MINLSRIKEFFKNKRRSIVLGLFIILIFHLLFSAGLCLSYVPEDLDFASGEKAAGEKGDIQIQKMRETIPTETKKQKQGLEEREKEKIPANEKRKTKGEKGKEFIMPPFQF